MELRAGLLFGAAGPQDSVIQSFRGLPPRSSGSHNLQNYHLALEDLRLATETEPELSWLDSLGWFCLCPQSAGELTPVDVAFHNADFPDSGKLAVIFHSPSEDSIAAELYTNLPNSPLHLKNIDAYRFGFRPARMERFPSFGLKCAIRPFSMPTKSRALSIAPSAGRNGRREYPGVGISTGYAVR